MMSFEKTSKETISLDQMVTERVSSEGAGPVTAALYARTSSTSQQYGYSIEEQLKRCWRRCEQLEWTVRFVFADEAETGRNTDRPEFQKLIQRAERQQIDVVVFWKLDRFCRSLVDLVNIEADLSTHNVALHSVTEHLDTTTPVGRFNFRTLAAAAELESDLTSERTQLGMHGLAQDGKWPNETPPLGYQLNKDRTLEIVIDEAELVYRIFQLYKRKKSMPAVAHHLNQHGITTQSGEQWSRQAIKTVLSNDLYTGHYEVAGFEQDVDEYRIIPDWLFEEVTEVRFRFQDSKPRMAQSRKEAKAESVLADYKNTVKGENV